MFGKLFMVVCFVGGVSELFLMRLTGASAAKKRSIGMSEDKVYR